MPFHFTTVDIERLSKSGEIQFFLGNATRKFVQYRTHSAVFRLPLPLLGFPTWARVLLGDLQGKIFVDFFTIGR